MSSSRVPLSDFLSAQAAGKAPAQVVAVSLLGAWSAVTAYRLLHDGDVCRRSFKYTLDRVRQLIAPIVRREVDKAAKAIKFPHAGEFETFDAIPAEGLSADRIDAISGALVKHLDKDMAEDKLSGVVYIGTSGKTEVISRAIKTHLWSNPLFADYFGAVRKIEAEVVEMMVNVFNGRTTGVPADEQQVGCYTFGGTESVLMAMLAMRNYAQRERGIKRPNVIVGMNAHPAFDKAAEYFNLRLVKVTPTAETAWALDPAEVEKHITYETIGIVGSAPSFAHGTVDPIEALAAIAVKHNLLFHVDACLGGMLVQFMQAAGYEQPLVDFRVKGVTSISCDIHKWGGSPKGASVVLYRGSWLRKHQTFAYADYPGGLYVTASVNGSKAGYVIAAAWATLLATGRNQYVANCKEVIKVARIFEAHARAVPLITIVGVPTISTVAISSPVLDIYSILEKLAAKGWLFNPCQFPPAIHLGVTLEHTQPGAMASLIADFTGIVEESAKELGYDSAAAAQAAYDAGTLRVSQKHRSLVYGSTQSIPDRNIVEQVLRRYVDNYYVNHRCTG